MTISGLSAIISCACFVLALLGVSAPVDLTLLGLAFLAAAHIPFGR